MASQGRRFILKLAEPFLEEKLTPESELTATRNLLKSPVNAYLPFFYTIEPEHPGPGVTGGNSDAFKVSPDR